MSPSRPFLPIRSLEIPARLGRRQRRRASAFSVADVRVRFERRNLAVARAARPVWLRGPLFQSVSSHPAFDAAQRAA